MAQGRRVRRVLRKVDTWSLAKMAFLFHLCMALVLVTAGVLLWTVAGGQGLVDSLEKTVRTNLQLDDFQIDGSALFNATIAAALVFAAIGTGLWVLGAFLFNLLSDLVGGVQVWVLEEVLFDHAQDEEALVADRPEPTGLEQHPQEPLAEQQADADPAGREPAPVG